MAVHVQGDSAWMPNSAACALLGDRDMDRWDLLRAFEGRRLWRRGRPHDLIQNGKCVQNESPYEQSSARTRAESNREVDQAKSAPAVQCDKHQSEVKIQSKSAGLIEADVSEYENEEDEPLQTQ